MNQEHRLANAIVGAIPWLVAVPTAYVVGRNLINAQHIYPPFAVAGAAGLEGLSFVATYVAITQWTHNREYGDSAPVWLGVLLAIAYAVVASILASFIVHDWTMMVYPTMTLIAGLARGLMKDLEYRKAAAQEATSHAGVIDERNAELARQERMEKYRLRKQLEHEEKMAALQLQVQVESEKVRTESENLRTEEVRTEKVRTETKRTEIEEYLRNNPDAKVKDVAERFEVSSPYVSNLRKEIIGSNGYGGSNDK